MAVWIGLAMRNAGIEAEAAAVLPYFLNTYFHPAVSGVFWAGLAITIVGGASGLCLGIATNISLDIVPRVTGLGKNDSRVLWVSRAAVILTVTAGAVMALLMKSAYILHLSYIGMGLRGAGMAVPFIAAILRPGLLTGTAAFASALSGLVFMMISWIFIPNAEPLFVGLTAAVVSALPSFFKKGEEREKIV
jgi:SSS family solute:Na+ symporter